MLAVVGKLVIIASVEASVSHTNIGIIDFLSRGITKPIRIKVIQSLVSFTVHTSPKSNSAVRVI